LLLFLGDADVTKRDIVLNIFNYSLTCRKQVNFIIIAFVVFIIAKKMLKEEKVEKK